MLHGPPPGLMESASCQAGILGFPLTVGKGGVELDQGLQAVQALGSPACLGRGFGPQSPHVTSNRAQKLTGGLWVSAERWGRGGEGVSGWRAPGGCRVRQIGFSLLVSEQPLVPGAPVPPPRGPGASLHVHLLP